MALRAGYHGIKNIKSSQIMLRSEQEILGAKNLLENKAVSGTRGTITITVNADKSITLSAGTSASTAAAPEINSSVFLAKGKYIVSSGVANKKVFMRVTIDGQHTPIYNKEIMIDLAADKTIEVRLYLVENTTLTESITFYPMIRLASDPDKTYVPYAMTNRELTVNRFEKGVLTSSSDLDDITETGIYKVRTAPAHAPENTGYCSLIVNSIDNNQCIQIVNKHNVMYQRRKFSPSTGVFEWSNWYKFTGTEVTPASLTSVSPETRSDAQELTADDPESTEDEPVVKKTTKKATKKTEEV